MESLDVNYVGEGIYRENILDHFKNPKNFGELEGASVKHREVNPLCGDEIEMQLKIKNEQIEDVKFNGKGCAISQSAASMLTQKIKGKNLKEINKIQREDIVEMLNIDIGPVRTKCAVLSLVALRNCLQSYNGGNKDA